jgi:hypothetical protein
VDRPVPALLPPVDESLKSKPKTAIAGKPSGAAEAASSKGGFPA